MGKDQKKLIEDRKRKLREGANTPEVNSLRNVGDFLGFSMSKNVLSHKNRCCIAQGDELSDDCISDR